MSRASFLSRLLDKGLKLIRLPEVTDQKVFNKKMEESKKEYVLPPKVRDRYGFSEYGEYSDTFVYTPNDFEGKRTIFYVHGGAYWSNPLILHYMFLKKIADKFNARIVLPVYPKAPAHHAEEVHKMVMDRYMKLHLDVNDNPANIILMGESAGGGLALAMLERMKLEHIPMPLCAFLHSPWLDVSMTNPEMKQLEKNDPLLSIADLTIKGQEYAGKYDVKDWRVSPIYGDMKDLPPIYVDCGTHEIFMADVLKLKKIAETQKLNMQVRIVEGQMHGFVGLPVPEARKLLDLMAEDLRTVENSCKR